MRPPSAAAGWEPPFPEGAPVMWVRQCELDAEIDDLPPIPARIASNEELVPPPQSAQQREYAARVAEIGVLRVPRRPREIERVRGGKAE